MDLGLGHGAALEDRPGAQLGAAVNNRDRFGVARQEQGFFQGAISAADDNDFFPLEKPTIAGGAVRHAAPGQLALAGYTQVIGGRPGGNDQRIRQILGVVAFHPKGPPTQIDRGGGVELDFGAKALGLLLE